jgi:hypothetical protein
MFKRFRKNQKETVDINHVLAGQLACHFADATVDGSRVTIPSRFLEVDCEVGSPDRLGENLAAVPLFFVLAGRDFAAEVSCSISGYGATPIDALQEGACLWGCSLAAMFDAADGQPTGEIEVINERLLISGRPFRILSTRMNRSLMTTQSTGGSLQDSIDGVRSNLVSEGGSMATAMLTAQTANNLPRLPWPTMSVLSSFMIAGMRERTVEIRINGLERPECAKPFHSADLGSVESIVLLRELAFVIPILEANEKSVLHQFERTSLQATLDQFASRDEPGNVGGWNGWRAHGGKLGSPMRAEDIDSRVPAEYTAFLTNVAGPGAGPGFGLEPPVLKGDRLLLAHAGCGNSWYLRTGETFHGEVWMDATGSGGSYSPVAPSFNRWYSDWLTASKSSTAPWIPWEPTNCSVVQVARQVREKIGENGDPVSIERITVADSAGNPLDACQACTEAVASVCANPEKVIPHGPIMRRLR